MPKRSQLGLGLLLSAMAVAIAEQGAKTTTSITPQDQYITYPGPQITQEQDYCETSASNDKPTPEEQSYLDELLRKLNDLINKYWEAITHKINLNDKLNDIDNHLRHMVQWGLIKKEWDLEFFYEHFFDGSFIIDDLWGPVVDKYGDEYIRIGITKDNWSTGRIIRVDIWNKLLEWKQIKEEYNKAVEDIENFKNEKNAAQKDYDAAENQVSTAIQTRLRLRKNKCSEQQQQEMYNKAWGVASQAGLLAALGLGAVGVKKGSNKYRRYTVTQKSKKYHEKTRNQRNAERAIQLQQQRNLRIPRH